MTLIYTPRHMDQLVSEIKTEWGENDPDLRRVADAIPIAVLEAAYLAKLDALKAPSEPFTRAKTRKQKLSVMRRIFASWLRCPHGRLGQHLINALGERPIDLEPILYNYEDGPLADRLRKYSLPK